MSHELDDDVLDDDELEEYDDLGIYNPERSPLYRDSRLLQLNVRIPHKFLYNFVTILKMELALAEKDIPIDIQNIIADELFKKQKRDQIYLTTSEKIIKIKEYNIFINTELKNRLKKLKIPYDESDIYVNVVNYAKAKGLNLSNNSVINQQVVPWLGSTDWDLDNNLGNARQTEKLHETIKRLNGGSKLYIKKKSCFNKRFRKISKKIDKF